jgi:hypothetical protein
MLPKMHKEVDAPRAGGTQHGCCAGGEFESWVGGRVRAVLVVQVAGMSYLGSEAGSMGFLEVVPLAGSVLGFGSRTILVVRSTFHFLFIGNLSNDANLDI